MTRYAVILAAVLGAIIGAFAYGVSVGKDSEKATQARVDQATHDTREAAQQGAAKAIALIKVTNTTIRGEVQREIQTNTVYRDCRVPVDGLRIINDALKGQRSVSLGSGQLSTPDSHGR